MSDNKPRLEKNSTVTVLEIGASTHRLLGILHIGGICAIPTKLRQQTSADFFLRHGIERRSIKEERYPTASMRSESNTRYIVLLTKVTRYRLQ